MASFLDSILNAFRKQPAARARVVRGRYDVAQTNQDNFRHWAMADGLSAAAANSPQVRQTLRNRARYEVANNSYARGLVETLADYVVGTGPRLQLIGPNQEENKDVAARFEDWTASVGLAEKLRTVKKARTVDGEAFALLTTNPRIRSQVQLDLRLVEADQIASPFPAVDEVDGISFDRFGNPREYYLLDQHPGDLGNIAAFGGYSRVSADLVLHWFRVDRPGQQRGVPDIMPALPLFAQLRRFTLATIAAAETAADFAAVMYSDLPPDQTDSTSDEEAVASDFERIDIDRRMMTTLPAGWKMEQFKAEHPATTYEMFKREILNEIARCLNVPYNVAAGNSSSLNYASGRLDHQTFFKSIKIDQYFLETAFLDRLLMAWLKEAYMASVIQEPPDRASGWRHQWFWDGFEHVDPVKEADAQATRLASNTTTLADEWAARGFDYREKLQQIADERKLMQQLGITPAAALPAQQPARQTSTDTEDRAA